MVLLMLMAVFSSLPFASASGGTISTFADGSSEITLDFSTGLHQEVNITLARNTTISTATFEIAYDAMDASPGQVVIDADNDTQPEWAFSGSGVGDIGAQTTFSAGGTSATTALTSSGYTAVNSWQLPLGAQVNGNDLDLTFTPQFGGDFLSVGAIDDMAMADTDNDGNPEPVFLKREHDSGNGTAWPHIGTADWTVASGFGSVTWTATCEGAEHISVGDMDGDGNVGVLAIAVQDATVCEHVNSGSGMGAYTNTTLGDDLLDAALADFTNDGEADLVWLEEDGHLGLRERSGSSFVAAAAAVTVDIQANGMPGQSSWGGFAIGDLKGTNDLRVVAGESAMMSVYNTFWTYNGGTSQWVMDNEDTQCSSGAMQVIDWNGDGADDFIGETSNGACMAWWNGTDWETQTVNLPSISNLTVGDLDADTQRELIVPNTGSIDGLDSTPTGNLAFHQFNVTTGAVQTSTRSEFTVTAPRDVQLSDLDGDGLPETVVVGGESSPGIWIAGWHRVDFDLGGQSPAEAVLTGFAGDGVGPTDPLTWSDQGNLSTLISNEVSAGTPLADAFGIEWVDITPTAYSRGAGDLEMSGLNTTYSVTFTVDINPGAGDFATVLNAQMLPGTGDVNVPMNISADAPGELRLSALDIDWTPGATFVALPEAPALTLEALSHEMVSLSWTASASQGDLLGYELFRIPDDGSTIFNLGMPHANTPEPFFEDTASVTNADWIYAVRSNHENGVNSNLSAPLSVSVPDVPPLIDETPPTFPEVSGNDVPGDEGGVLNLSFIASPEADLAYTLLFLEAAPFGDASALTPVANISADADNWTLASSTGDGAAIEDGAPLYAAGIPVDDLGNVWWNASSSGPFSTRNDSVAPSSLALSVTGADAYDDGERTGAHVYAGAPLSISVELTSEGNPLEGELIDFVIANEMSGDWHTFGLVTDAQGQATKDWADWADVVNEVGQAFMGAGTISANWMGGTMGADAQDVAPASAGGDLVATVNATLAIVESEIQLDAAGQSGANLSLTADDASQQGALAGIGIQWHMRNTSNGVSGDVSTAIPDANGDASISIHYPTGGELTASVMPPWWLTMTQNWSQVDVFPAPPVIVEPEPETLWLLPLDVDCGVPWTLPADSAELVENAELGTHVCTLTNPNNVSVYLAASAITDVETPDITMLGGSSLFIQALAELDLQFETSNWLTATPLNGSIDVTLEMTAADWEDNTTAFTLEWTIVEDDAPIDENPDNSGNGGTDGPDPGTGPSGGEGGSGMVWIAVVIVAFVLIGAVGFVVLRTRDDFDLDDDDEDDYEDDDDPEPEPVSRPKAKRPADLPSGKSLAELKAEGADTAVSMKPRKRVSRRAEPEGEPEPEPEEAYEEEAEADGEHDYTQDEDYHVDDDGTEWWKDELGVWWYRYPDEEEWEAYED